MRRAEIVRAKSGFVSAASRYPGAAGAASRWRRRRASRRAGSFPPNRAASIADRRCLRRARPAADIWRPRDSSTARISPACSSNRVRPRICVASRPAPSMRSIGRVSVISGRESKRTRIAAPLPAGCDSNVACRYAIASATSASVLSSAARSEPGASFSSSCRPSSLRTKRPSNWRSDSNSRRSALKFCKGSLNHG